MKKVQNKTKNTYNNTYDNNNNNNNITEVIGRNASILKTLISLFLNVTNQYRICFKEVILIITKKKANEIMGQVVQVGGIKICYAILVGKLKFVWMHRGVLRYIQ